MSMTENTGVPAVTIAAELDLLDLRRDARHRRAQHRVVEIALRHVELRLGLRVGRKLRQRQIGIAEQLRLGVGELLLDELRLRARGDESGGGIVEVELRADLLLDQRLLAIDVALLQVDALLREVEHLAVDLDVGDQIVIGGLGLLELGLGLVERELERHGIDLEQLVARLDVLAFLHHDLDDLAGDVGRDQHLLRADIGVVGGHVAAAIEIEHEPADRCRRAAARPAAGSGGSAACRPSAGGAARRRASWSAGRRARPSARVEISGPDQP